MKLLVKKLYEDAITPTRAYSTDSGLDIFAYIPDKKSIIIHPFLDIYNNKKYLENEEIDIEFSEVKYSKSNAVLISTGIAIKLPDPQYIRVGSNDSMDSVDRAVYTEEKIVYECQLRGKSGLAVKKIQVHFGTIDSSYTSEIKAMVFNHSHESIEIKHGQKIAQLVITPVFIPTLELVDSFEEGERGNKGFGSTGLFKEVGGKY